MGKNYNNLIFNIEKININRNKKIKMSTIKEALKTINFFRYHPNMFLKKNEARKTELFEQNTSKANLKTIEKLNQIISNLYPLPRLLLSSKLCEFAEENLSSYKGTRQREQYLAGNKIEKLDSSESDGDFGLISKKLLKNFEELTASIIFNLSDKNCLATHFLTNLGTKSFGLAYKELDEETIFAVIIFSKIDLTQLENLINSKHKANIKTKPSDGEEDENNENKTRGDDSDVSKLNNERNNVNHYIKRNYENDSDDDDSPKPRYKNKVATRNQSHTATDSQFYGKILEKMSKNKFSHNNNSNNKTATNFPKDIKSDEDEIPKNKENKMTKSLLINDKKIDTNSKENQKNNFSISDKRRYSNKDMRKIVDSREKNENSNNDNDKKYYYSNKESLKQQNLQTESVLNKKNPVVSPIKKLYNSKVTKTEDNEKNRKNSNKNICLSERKDEKRNENISAKKENQCQSQFDGSVSSRAKCNLFLEQQPKRKVSVQPSKDLKAVSKLQKPVISFPFENNPISQRKPLNKDNFYQKNDDSRKQKEGPVKILNSQRLSTNESNDKKKKDNSLSNINNKTERDRENEIERFQKEIQKKQHSIDTKINRILKRSTLPLLNTEEYLTIKKLGVGTYGQIFLAQHLPTHNTFALKKKIADSIEEVSEYYSEFEIIHGNKHPNIIEVFSANIKPLDLTTIAIYILMELAESDWEKEIIKRKRTNNYFTEEELLNIMKELLSALNFLQMKKVSHRDIKPQNILIFNDGRYKLADFGEAKKVRKLHSMNTLRGTDSFMSPILFESMLKNEEETVHNPFKSDVYSLACCFAFAGNLSCEIINEIRCAKVKDKIRRLLNMKFNKRYSRAFIEMIVLMLEYDEEKRMDFNELNEYFTKNFPDVK